MNEETVLNPSELDLMGRSTVGPGQPDTPKPIPTPRPPTTPARLTVVETLYHQSPGQDAVSVSGGFSAATGDDAPYRRPLLKVGRGLVLLDTGWVENPGQVFLRNEPPTWDLQPTPEQRAEAEARVVELSVKLDMDHDSVSRHSFVPFARIRPGESVRLEPVGPLYARCLSGEARCLVVAFPCRPTLQPNPGG